MVGTPQDWAEPGQVEPPRLTVFQRAVLRRLRRAAGKEGAEPLDANAWTLVWTMHHTRRSRLLHQAFARLPSSPRCCQCGAPFAGVGRLLTRPLGYRPSRKNPHYCATCVELSPPGGTTMPVGIMFADIRGFTTTSAASSASDTAALLRRFYGCTEAVVFPEGIIDKLIGDEVMVLYLGYVHQGDGAPAIMLDHGRKLLELVGYGTAEGPFIDVGIGLDYGNAYVGNIGDRAIHDFTAVGDVVNTASRLQGHARGGEIVLSSRVARHLDGDVGIPDTVDIRGKPEPEAVRRLTIGGAPA